MSGIKPPATIILSETSFDDFTLWMQAFDDYLMLTGKDDKGNKKVYC